MMTNRLFSVIMCIIMGCLVHGLKLHKVSTALKLKLNNLDELEFATNSSKPSTESIVIQKRVPKVLLQKHILKVLQQKHSPKVLQQKLSPKVLQQKHSNVLQQKLSPKVLQQKHIAKVLQQKHSNVLQQKHIANVFQLDNGDTNKKTVEEIQSIKPDGAKTHVIIVNGKPTPGSVPKKSRFKGSDVIAFFSIIVFPLSFFLANKNFCLASTTIAMSMFIFFFYHKWYMIYWHLKHNAKGFWAVSACILLLMIILVVALHPRGQAAHFSYGFIMTLLLANVPYQIVLASFFDSDPWAIRVPVLLAFGFFGGVVFSTQFFKKFSEAVGVPIIRAWMFVAGIDHFGKKVHFWATMPMSPEPEGYFFRNLRPVLAQEASHAFVFYGLWAFLSLVPVVFNFCRKKKSTDS